MFRKKLAIDLGTANTLVWVAGEGVVLNEPTVVAYSTSNQQIIAVGDEAKEMLGRTSGLVKAIRPLKEGVIADYTFTKAMVSYYIKKASRNKLIFKTDLMVSVPGGSSPTEKRAIISACRAAGATEVYLMEEPLAAAIGAKIPISLASGHMIVNLGGGTAEIAVISLGHLVVYESVRVAGTKFDEAIIAHMRKKYNLVIGESTAENVKIGAGNVFKPEASTDLSFEVKGRDTITGLPTVVSVSEEMISDALQEPAKQILEGVKRVLAETPPELASDIVDKGIVLSGGTSLLKGFDRYLSDALGVSVFVTEEPLFCVIRGLGVAIENLDSYKDAVK